MDPSFVARIEIPRNSRADIVAQIETIQKEDIKISGGLREEVDWWPPPIEAVIIDRECLQVDGDYFRAAVTEEDGRFILYISHAVD